MSSRSIRAHLVRLVSAAAIPLLLFSIAVAAWNAVATRKAVERGLQDTVHALSLALEEQIGTWTGALNALATSPAIDAGNLREFRRQAIEVTSLHGGSVCLIARDGRLVAMTRGEREAPLPHASTAYSEQVFRTGKPVVSNLFTSSLNAEPTLSIYVPVRRDGEVRFVLGMNLTPERLAARMARQNLPRTWLGMVTDGNGRIVARVKDPARFLGQQAPAWYIEAVSRNETGMIAGKSLDADPITLAYERIPPWPWTVAVAVPGGEMAAAWSPAIAMAAVGLVLTVLAIGLSLVYARRIDEGVRSLLEGHPSRHPIREFEEVRMRLRAQVEERERRRAAEAAGAEAANRSKDFFLSTLSHELRTPISAIMGWIAVIRTRRDDPARLERALQVIERNAMQQAKLIDDLLDVSRIISGKMKVERKPTDLSRAVSGVIDGLRPAAQEKRVALAAEVAPGIRVYGDHVRLVQIANNLLSNALKFTPAGGRIEARLERGDSGALLTVRDNGRGIDPALLPHLFARFSQAEASVPEYQPGLGLGLAIVRHLVERHGGSVSAESRGPGSGATFRVRLPALSLVEDSGSRAATTRAEAARLAGLRVLVVDDHEDTRQWLCSLLSAHGASIAQASHAGEALAVHERFRADLLLSDIAMPRGDGFALIRALRAKEQSRRTPAIAFTALATDEDRQRVRAAGYDEVIAKGSDPSVVLAAVHRLGRAVTAG